MTVMTSSSSSTLSSQKTSNWRGKNLRSRMDLYYAALIVNRQLALRTYFHWGSIWKSFILKACFSSIRLLKFNSQLWSITLTSMKRLASIRMRLPTACASARSSLRRLPEQSCTYTLSRPVITRWSSAQSAVFSWSVKIVRSTKNRNVCHLSKVSSSNKPWRRYSQLPRDRRISTWSPHLHNQCQMKTKRRKRIN